MPNLGLQSIPERFGHIALANSPWFGGIAIQPDFLEQNIDIHPKIVHQVLKALEERNPRHKIAGRELRITFDLLGPEETEDVQKLADNLAFVFGGRVGFLILRDKEARETDSKEFDDGVGADVIPLRRIKPEDS